MATRSYRHILAIYLVDLLHRCRRRQVRRRQMPYRGEKFSINPRFGNSRHSHINSHCFMSLSFTFCCWFSVEGLSLWIMYVKIMPTTFCSLGCQPTSKRTPGSKGWIFNVVPWLFSMPSTILAGWLADKLIVRSNGIFIGFPYLARI